MKSLKLLVAISCLLLILTACTKEQVMRQADAVDILLSDQQIMVAGVAAETTPHDGVYVAHDIVYYESGKDFTYGEGALQDAHTAEEADAHTVVHITQPGTYRLSGKLSRGQIAVDLGEDAKNDPDAVVTLILDGAEITCEVAPAVIFYRVYECGDTDEATKDVDTSAAGAVVTLADGTYAYSKLASYSAVTYATNQLKNSTDTALKQLAAAMLNYGAEAQTYFGHNTSALANASLSAEQKALPETYRDDMVSSVPAASVAKQGSFANNQGFASRKPAISFEGAFCINYFFTPNYAPDSGITLYYWNAEDYNAASVLTTANASGFLTLEGSGTGEYRGDITGISAKALSEAVYVAAVYTNGGTTWTSGVLGYSIGSYCVSQASKGGDIANLAMATAVYGYHAKQYFG